MHTAPYFTAFGFLVVYFSSRVIKLRKLRQVSIGDGGFADLHQAIRAFGNLIEYATFGLVLLFALEFVQAPVWFLHLCGLTLLVGRILHGFAFSQPQIVMKFRIAGMVLTWFSIVVSAIGITAFSMMELHP